MRLCIKDQHRKAITLLSLEKLIKFCFFILIIPGVLQAGYGQGIEQKIQLSLSAGPQKDNLNWSIAGNTSGQSPNILSELKWQNMKGANYAATLQFNFWRNIVVLGGFDLVSVKSGSVSDIDYAADNRSK